MYKIPLMRPRLTADTRQAVLDVLDSGYWTEGPVTRELEESFESYIQCAHALAVTSCTTGLEIALRALGIGPGDEVIVPDYTYPATAAAANIVGAKVVLVDVDPATMLIDYDTLERAITPKTRAILPVSLFGNPLDHARLSAITKPAGIHVVEDAACSIGALYRGERVGTQADITVFSLHPRKFITTGEGGIVTTADGALADWMNSYKHFGMDVKDGKVSPQFVRVGTNYKLSNILAAVGLSQMREIDALLTRRVELAAGYCDRLSGSGVALQKTTPEGINSRQSFCLRVPNRDRVMKEMREIGIEVQIGSYALHQEPAFAESDLCEHRGNLAGSTTCFDEALVLPLHHDLTSEDQDAVIGELLKRI